MAIFHRDLGHEILFYELYIYIYIYDKYALLFFLYFFLPFNANIPHVQ